MEKHSFEQAVELACRRPNLVAGKVLKAGLCETDLYLFSQKLYGEIVRRDSFAAEVFARELRERGYLALAFAGR